MCRLAAYMGPELPLAQFLFAPAHGLVEQAWNPQELLFGRMNVDGFGIGWYADDDRPAVYVSALPIWADVNLPHLGRSLVNDLWLGSVRSATSGASTDPVNSQPFCDEELMFMHNGLLEDFGRRVRPSLRQHLSPDIEAGVRGSTDSEYLFALLRHLLADDEELSIEDALADMSGLIGEWAGTGQALLNVVVTDGERLYATRHALNHRCPSLYYTTDDESFPGAQLVASERLTDAAFWQPVPEHHVLVLDPDEPPELVAL
ncbi:MAG: class II glutamine amidotransferase [Gammaproteobacteria bacterium]|nr:class II glutamine amidotransferase [Gammaproteobacteria bacterium]